jgi:hypothetical protein
MVVAKPGSSRRGGWRTTAIFWAATCISCVWFAFAAAIGVAGSQLLFADGFSPNGRGTVEILIAVALTFQPILILFLILRAIRRRGAGSPLRRIVRAFYPLVPALLLVGDVKALQYLDAQSEMRRVSRWSIGSITYVCSTSSRTIDYHATTIGAVELRLKEIRHPGKPGTWIVVWPGKKPIEARSFPTQSGSIGGSRGIEWREPDGRHMIAYLSFSDIMTEYGPAGFWAVLVQSDRLLNFVNPATVPSTNFTCGPDLGSYRD